MGSGYNARVAIINALYAMHPHWAKMSAVLVANAITRRDSAFAWCYSTPVTEVHRQAACVAAPALACFVPSATLLVLYYEG